MLYLLFVQKILMDTMENEMDCEYTVKTNFFDLNIG